MTCPHCKEAARFVTYRPKIFTSLLGDLHIERGYYHCRACGHGHFPWDQTLRLSERMTPAAREVVALSGIKESFGKVADRSLYKQTGLRLSESTVQRTTEAAGERLGQLLEKGAVFGEACPWDWHRDHAGQTCGYISVDATGIMIQGPDGAKADGRMIHVGMIYNPQPRSPDEEDIAKPCDGARYLTELSGPGSLKQLGEQLRRQAAQVGLNDVEQWLALSDAGNGLEDFFDVYFPRAEKILDFRHATDHLTPLANLLRPGKAGEALLSAWCHQLKHQGGTKLLASLDKLDRSTMDEATQVEHQKTLTFFTNHSARMNYPEYLKRGWQIGSGSIESACKNVINQRLNMGGMRWGEEGGDALAHLRALFCSEADQWDAFWSLAA
jgi:hypothetical protein